MNYIVFQILFSIPVLSSFREQNDFMLAAQRDKIIRINLETNSMDPLPILNLKNVIAIDFDMRNNCVYWADIVTDTIGVCIIFTCVGKMNYYLG